MSSKDYLMPFVEVVRALSDLADVQSIMYLVVKRITETLNLKGCFIKALDRSKEKLETVASYGLTEYFILSEPSRSDKSICSCLPQKLICCHNLQEATDIPEQEQLMVEGIRSFAIIPLEIGQEIIGMVSLFGHDVRDFSKDEINFAKTLAGIAIYARFQEEEKERKVAKERQYLKSFQEVSAAINSSLNVNKVLQLVVTKTTELLGAIGCVIRLLDPKTQQLYVAQSYGLSEEFLQKGPVYAHQSIAENMAGRTVIIDDVFTDPRLQYRAEVVESGIRRIISIPLEVRGKVIGVLRVMAGDRPPFTEDEIQFAQAIAQQCAFALENARMYQRLKYEYQQLLIEFGYNGSSK